MEQTIACHGDKTEAGLSSTTDQTSTLLTRQSKVYERRNHKNILLISGSQFTRSYSQNHITDNTRDIMATTMDAEPWEYIDVLNECLRIILTIALGATLSYFNIFDATTFVPVATRFVFHVALPSLVIRGLGIGIDFYDNNFSWNFIVVFLILRAVALVVAIGWVYWFQGGGEGMIGQVAVVWLSLTWISTVILGIPISKAVFGSDQLGMFYGLVRLYLYRFGLRMTSLFGFLSIIIQNAHNIPY